MQTTFTSTAEKRSDNAHAEPMKFQQRIGSTVYTVSVRFSKTSSETIEDKIFKLIESEVCKTA